MTQVFAPKYEFDVSTSRGHKEVRTVICASGSIGSNGEGSVRFWLEKHHPETYDFETTEFHPAFTETILGTTVFSYELVRSKNKWSENDRDWLLRQMVISIARGDIGGESASSVLYDIFWQAVIKKRETWIMRGAPEWFALVDPKNRKE